MERRNRPRYSELVEEGAAARATVEAPASDAAHENTARASAAHPTLSRGRAASCWWPATAAARCSTSS
eukprot:2416264-Prymnesium_polylepis.1